MSLSKSCRSLRHYCICLYLCPIYLLNRISKNIKGNTCATWLSMEHSREKGDEKGGFLVAFMKATPTQ